MTNTKQQARLELGRFLRTMRDRAAPPPVSRFALAGARRTRRAPGLRREEVAHAAGISTTWYTWLEQGRPLGASSQTLRAIAQALQLRDEEHRYLRRLAAVASGDQPGAVRRWPEPSPTSTLLLDALRPHAAWVVNAWWDVLLVNDAGTALLGPTERLPWATDNFMRQLLLDEGWRRRFIGWESVALAVVAQFRAATATSVGEPRWEAFVDELSAASCAFRSLWARHDVAPPTSRMVHLLANDGTPHAYHVGALAVDPPASGLRVVVLVPAAGAGPMPLAATGPAPPSAATVRQNGTRAIGTDEGASDVGATV